MGVNQSTTIPSSDKQRQSHQLLELEYSDEDYPYIWALQSGNDALDWTKNCTSEDELVEQIMKHQQLPVSITPNLYLGDIGCLLNDDSVTKLQRLNIGGILNMAGTSLNIPRRTLWELKRRHINIQYKSIDAEDSPNYPLLEKHGIEAFDFISSIINNNEDEEGDGGTDNNHQSNSNGNNSNTNNNNNNCLVLCRAGMNRSVLIVASYYMITTRTNVLETIKHIRKQRGNIALANNGFQEQLIALARKHNLLGACPGTKHSIIQDIPPPMPQTIDCWRVSSPSLSSKVTTTTKTTNMKSSSSSGDGGSSSNNKRMPKQIVRIAPNFFSS